MLNGTVFLKKATSNSLELPIYFPPPINAYLQLSILSSIILANDLNGNWLYNQFIQLYQKSNSARIDYYPNLDFSYADQSLLTSTEFSSQNYVIKKEEFIDNIIFWLNHSNYVIVYCSESEIPGTRFYMESPKLHSQFIYGYDLTKKVFKFMNYAKKTDYLARMELSFDDLYASFFSENTRKLMCEPHLNWLSRDKKFKIILLKYKEHEDPNYYNEINLELINNNIHNYLYSKNSSFQTNYFTSLQKGTWGISVFENFIKYMEELNGKKLDYRQFHLINEHKELMSLRMKKLKETFDIDYDIEGFSHLVKLSTIARNMSIKYHISKSESTLHHIIELINQLYNEEQALLTKYLCNFK